MSAVVTGPPFHRRDERRIRSTCGVVDHAGRTVLRTPALEEHDATWFAERGFTRTQALVMLCRACRPDAVDDGIGSYRWRGLRSRRNEPLLASLLEVDAASFPPPWNLSPAAFGRACGATSEHVVLVRRRPAGDASAFAVVGRSATTAYLQRLAVHPSVRRRGLATLLVRHASAWAAARGADTLYVNTEPTNDAALSLYDRLGFVRLPRRLWVLERPEREAT